MISRQSLIDNWDQKKISKISILIGGCGATGSQVAIKLARLGVGKIILVDNDILEEHNLENQEFAKRDIGTAKAIALKDKIQDISETKVKIYVGLIQNLPETLLTEPEYYFSCFDNFQARFYLNALTVFKNKIMIDSGIHGLTGTVRTVIPGLTPCLECWPSLLPESGLRASCSKDPIPSTYITASHAADLMVSQLIKLAFDWKTEPYIFFDLRRDFCRPIYLSMNENCTLCGKNEKKNY